MGATILEGTELDIVICCPEEALDATPTEEDAMILEGVEVITILLGVMLGVVAIEEEGAILLVTDEADTTVLCVGV